jgi:hypothetical protein
VEGRGRSKWSPGGLVDQWSPIRVILERSRSRIQIRIEVKSRMGIRIKVKIRFEFFLNAPQSERLNQNLNYSCMTDIGATVKE